MCVQYLTLQTKTRQTNYTIWISTSIYPSMHSFRLQNRSWLSLQFTLKSQFCSDWLSPPFVCSQRFSHSLDTLCPCCTLICAYCDRGQRRFSSLADWNPSFTAALELDSGCPGASYLPTIIQNSAWCICMLNTSTSLSTQDHMLHHVVAPDLVVKTSRSCGQDTSLCC